MRVMHWFRVNGSTFCGRVQLAGFNKRRNCKACIRLMEDPGANVRIVFYKKERT